MLTTRHGSVRSLSRTLALGVGLAMTPVVFAAGSLLAQDQTAAPAPQDQGPGPGGRHMDPAARQQHELDMMTKKLNLNPDQVSQIKSIQSDTMSQMQALRADNSTAGPDRRTKMMDLHKAEHDKIRNVLNDDQKTKFDAMAEHQRERHERNGNDAPPPPPPAM